MGRLSPPQNFLRSKTDSQTEMYKFVPVPSLRFTSDQRSATVSQPNTTSFDEMLSEQLFTLFDMSYAQVRPSIA